MLGAMPVGMGTHANSTIWTGYQAAGAYIVLVLAQLRIGWPYFRQVWQTAFGRHKTLDDRDELMSYRAASLGLAISFVGIVGATERTTHDTKTSWRFHLWESWRGFGWQE